MRKSVVLICACIIAVMLSAIIISITNNGRLDYREPSRPHKLTLPTSAKLPDQEVIKTNSSVGRVVDQRTVTEKDLNRFGLTLSNSFSVSAKRK